jgi:hypothetical protein
MNEQSDNLTSWAAKNTECNITCTESHLALTLDFFQIPIVGTLNLCLEKLASMLKELVKSDEQVLR